MHRSLTLARSLVAIAAVAILIPACGDSSDDGNGSGATFRTTTWFGVLTGTTSAGNANMPILSNDDLTLFLSQTGGTQAAGNGTILVGVQTTGGAGIAGVQMAAVNEAGLSAGTPIYRNLAGQFQLSLTSTTSRGEAMFFNVAPGRVNVRLTAGAPGNAYVEVVADQHTLVSIVSAAAAPANATWSGVTRVHTNAPGAAVASVTATGIATGSPFPFTSNGTGNFGPVVTPGSQSYMVRASAAAHHDTHNVFNLGTGAVGQDIFVVPQTADADTNFVPSDVTLTAGASIVRSRVVPTGTTDDGFAVTVTDLAGNAVGDVRHANASGVPQLATATVTQTGGIFYVYNLTAGATFLIRATKTAGTSFQGTAYVDTFAPVAPATRQVTFLSSVPTSTTGSASTTITLVGSLVTFTGAFGVGDATINRLGDASVTTNNSGQFTMNNVPAAANLRIRTSKP